MEECAPECGERPKAPAGERESGVCAVLLVNRGLGGLPLPEAGSGQGQGAPGILSHRGSDFSRRGQADTYVQPVLT